MKSKEVTNFLTVRTNSSEQGQQTLGGGVKWVSTSQIIQFAVKIVRGLVIPKLLSPSYYGLFRSVGLLLRYTSYSDFGVEQQLQKRLPEKLMREGEKGFEELASQGLSWILLTSVIVTLGIVVAGLFQSGESAWFYRPAFCLIAGVSFVQKSRLSYATLLRSQERFRELSIGNILTVTVGLVLAVIMLLIYGVIGLVWSLIIAEIAGLIFYLKVQGWNELKVLRINLFKTITMVREGIKLILIKFSELAIGTTDQLFLVFLYSKTEYGLYGFGLFIVNASLIFSGIFATTMYPRMMNLVGKSKYREVYQLVNKALIANAIISVLCIMVGLPFIDWFIRYYLPDYTKGIPVYFLLAVMAYLRGLVFLMKFYFIAQNEESKIVKIYILFALLAIGLNACVFYLGLGIEFIAGATVVVYFLLHIVLSIFLEKRHAKIEYAKYLIITTGFGCLMLMYGVFKSVELQWIGLSRTTSLMAISLFCIIIIGSVFCVFKTTVQESLRYFWKT